MKYSTYGIIKEGRENFKRESTPKKASENLKSRLVPFLSETGSWLESIRNAVAAGVSMQETVIENNADNKDGTAEYYYYGCSLAMVEIDSLRWSFYLMLAFHWLRYSTSDSLRAIETPCEWRIKNSKIQADYGHW